MNIDNVDYQMSYIRSDEAGKFLTFLVDKDVKGAINVLRMVRFYKGNYRIC